MKRELQNCKRRRLSIVGVFCSLRTACWFSGILADGGIPHNLQGVAEAFLQFAVQLAVLDNTLENGTSTLKQRSHGVAVDTPRSKEIDNPSDLLDLLGAFRVVTEFVAKSLGIPHLLSELVGGEFVDGRVEGIFGETDKLDSVHVVVVELVANTIDEEEEGGVISNSEALTQVKIVFTIHFAHVDVGGHVHKVTSCVPFTHCRFALFAPACVEHDVEHPVFRITHVQIEVFFLNLVNFGSQ
mmetsp:Transcript_38199/g.75184  ORF Transcript_38199/g.75184 Transcript_38199/m.75184 type:complete len:241 (-) Transcript_38199:1606-2328(-)